MSAASFLREAADRLEELAEKATPGPWEAKPAIAGNDPDCEAAWEVDAPTGDVVYVEYDRDYGDPEGGTNEPNALLIATFGNPQVARAVADWLRNESQGMQTEIGEPTAHALAVAAAVLGRPAPDQGRSE